NDEVSGKITYYQYEALTEGYAYAKFSDSFQISGNGSGWLEGFISGQGFLTGIVTGNATGYAGLPTGEDLRGTKNVIQDATGEYSELFYATGISYYDFDIPASGMASSGDW